MTKDTLKKMLAGLTDEEKTATLNELGITDAATVAELTATAAPETVPAVAVQQPAIQQQPTPVEAAQAAASAAGGNAEVAQLQAQLAIERTARIAADCDAFVTSMKTAGKVTPAEESTVRTLFASLAGQADPAALNQYKASIQARPASPMLAEQVASNGQLQVLGNAAGVDTRTEAEKEAALVAAMLDKTDEGKQAAAAVAAGEVKPAFKQFAISQ